MTDPRVFMIAGEASGDGLAAALIDGLRALAPDTAFSGIAGPQMQERGIASLFPMEELSLMGLAEILPKYWHLRRRIRQTADAVVAANPDVLITVDSPDFCLRVARLVRARAPAIRIVHYVAPTVWAWRPKRAEHMAPFVDQVLALLPFEPPYMEAAGMRCDFVGHPVVAQEVARPVPAEALREELLGDRAGPLVLVLPGSRRSEVTRLTPRFGEALALLADRYPGMAAVLPVAPSVGPLVMEIVADWPVPVSVLDAAGRTPETAAARKRAAFRGADVALAASGTVSLELAAAGTPMVIGYDMAWLTIQIVRRMALIESVNMVNIVSGTRAIPELLGGDCRPDKLASALAATLEAPEEQLEAAGRAMDLLGRGGEAPGLRAARAVLDGLDRPAGGACGQ